MKDWSNYYEERLRDLALFNLEEKGFGRDFISVYKNLKGECNEDEAGLFSVVPSARTGDGRCKLNRMIPLNTRQHWHSLPSEAVESSPWRSLTVVWTWSWAVYFGWLCLHRNGSKQALYVPSNLNHAVILRFQAHPLQFWVRHIWRMGLLHNSWKLAVTAVGKSF